jgi:hypothetical protein
MPFVVKVDATSMDFYFFISLCTHLRRDMKHANSERHTLNTLEQGFITVYPHVKNHTIGFYVILWLPKEYNLCELLYSGG